MVGPSAGRYLYAVSSALYADMSVSEWSVWMMKILRKVETESKDFVNWFAYTVKLGYGEVQGTFGLTSLYV